MKITATHLSFYRAKAAPVPKWGERFNTSPDINSLINLSSGFKPTGSTHTHNAVALLALVRRNNSHTGETLLGYLEAYRPHSTCPARRVAMFRKVLKRLRAEKILSAGKIALDKSNKPSNAS